MADLAVCPRCGAKNRLAGQSERIPVCGRCRGSLPWMVNAGDATFDSEVASPQTVLVDLWAPWCGPCRAMAPVLEELARDFAGQLKVVKVNVDHNPATQARFEVRGIPTLLLFHGGSVVEKIVGAQSKTALERILRAHVPPEGGKRND